ncbi:hypothetical protein [Pararhodobacter sp.]|uniref:hypothetical protein n=1 Tax=Pararhodobacter sp. TaxID=2127056 RepID=UPI002AFDD190|nr:hypothetical protein [Pararhodobacter sp.]
MTHDAPDHFEPTPEGLPKLVKLYFVQVAIGFALSAVFVALLLGFNVANLRGLMMSTQGGYIAAGLLFFFNGLVFAGVQFAITIMRMAAPEDKGPRGGRRAPQATNTPVRVRAAAGRH